MTTEHNSHNHVPSKSRFNWVLLGFLAIVAYFLLTEHRAHLLGILPWLLLLACLLMHLFMHGGHGDGDRHPDKRS